MVGYQEFRSEAYQSNTFSQCPRIIIEFKQNIYDKSPKKNFESPSHQIAAYLVRCITDYGDMNPPDFLVGVLIDLDQAEVYFINSKMILENKMETKGVYKLTMKWEFDMIIRGFEHPIDDQNTTDEMLKAFNNQIKSSIELFHRLMDFMSFLCK